MTSVYAHKYIEDPRRFILADLTQPRKMIKEMCIYEKSTELFITQYYGVLLLALSADVASHLIPINTHKYTKRVVILGRYGIL